MQAGSSFSTPWSSSGEAHAHTVLEGMLKEHGLFGAGGVIGIRLLEDRREHEQDAELGSGELVECDDEHRASSVFRTRRARIAAVILAPRHGENVARPCVTVISWRIIGLQ